MASKAGRWGKVTIWEAAVWPGPKTEEQKVKGMGVWTMSGLVRDVLEDSEFGNDVKKFQFGMLDGGEIVCRGNYDPEDEISKGGIMAIREAVDHNDTFGSGEIRLYIDSTSYYTVESGGEILFTRVETITMDKNGLGQLEFSCKVSNAAMVLL